MLLKETLWSSFLVSCYLRLICLISKTHSKGTEIHRERERSQKEVLPTIPHRIQSLVIKLLGLGVKKNKFSLKRTEQACSDVRVFVYVSLLELIQYKIIVFPCWLVSTEFPKLYCLLLLPLSFLSH